MLQLYNSMTKTKSIFKPMFENEVGMYVCGVTVYDFCHVGNARVFIVFDVLARYLRSLGYKVNYTRNITDIDDKIINRAKAENKSFHEIAERYTQEFNTDMRSLGVLSPTHEPKATEYVSHMLDMIRTLLEKGYAYVGENGDVYYDVSKFADYGKLSHQDLTALRAGERVAVSESKTDPLDFVLWKIAKEGEPSWESPWGAGRPGWHIECSAMSLHCLDHHFDIHGGGIDLTFPHHENEIAQSEAATEFKFMNYWMHVGFVQVNKEKMSKSLGNFFTVRDVCAKYDPEILRYFILSSHYRSPTNYSEENLLQAKTALERLYLVLRDSAVKANQTVDENNEYVTRFKASMDDDLNTPGALSVLFDISHEMNKIRASDPVRADQLAGVLLHLGGILGLLEREPAAFLQGDNASVEHIERLVAERDRARAEKNWAASDRLRKELESLNVIVEDTPRGTIWRKG